MISTPGKVGLENFDNIEKFKKPSEENARIELKLKMKNLTQKMIPKFKNSSIFNCCFYEIQFNGLPIKSQVFF